MRYAMGVNVKYTEEAKQIIAYVGGKQNIINLVHCATRLRFELKDKSRSNKEALKKMPYVLQVMVSGGQLQVVIGSAVQDYYNAIVELAGITGKNNEDTANAKIKKGNFADQIMKVISGAFSPLIPLLAGAGMIKALLTVLTEAHILDGADSTYAILSAAGNAVFYFLPIFLGITLAKQLGANAYVGGAIGAALLEPNFTALIGTEGTTDFLGIRITPTDYASTVFPIFVSMIVYSLLEKALKKIIKQELQLFLVPMFSLMIMVPFSVIVFGPFGNVLGNGVSDVVMWLFNFNKTVAGFILGATYPFLTILGLHWGFTPITLQNLTEFGGDIIEGVAVCAVYAEIGIAIGAYLKGKKHSRIRRIAGPSILTGIFAGVTEPILYGVIMNYKRLMAVIAISSGIGGAVNGTLHVTCDAYVFHNIFSLAMRTYSPYSGFLFGISTALILGVLLTYFWGISPDDRKDFDVEGKEEKEPAGTITADAGQDKLLDILAPLDGKVILLQDVEDEVFSSGVTGKGIAINPDNDEVIAPCDGTVTALFSSRHAIGITTEEGVEILIHIGLNTVMLHGEGFEIFVKQGDKVKAGQKLIHFDREKIRKMGYSLVSPVLVSNADEFKDIIINEKKLVTRGEMAYQVMI